MSDSKKVPKPPPPDDLTKTTPNIDIPKPGSSRDDEPTDWEKTNYGFSPQPPADDWGKTVANYNIPSRNENSEPGRDKNHNPSDQPKASDDWGMTRANIDLPADFGSKPEDFGKSEKEPEAGYEMTTPLIRLPEAERAKYQNLPPTPAQKSAAEEEAKKDKTIAGMPPWFWISAGLMTMFFFAVVVILAAWYLISTRTDFNVVVKNAPPRSEIRVNSANWGVPTSDDGSIILQGLKAETKRIEIIHPSYECQPIEIEGGKRVGETVETIARCSTKKVAPGEDCTNIGIGEEDKAERCANAALDALPDPPPLDELLKALNLLIINFESGKFDIPDERMAFLKRASGYIQKLPPGTTIEIGGHTDSVGPNESNQTLSENRAKAVKNALVAFGVKPETLVEKGYGETNLKFPEEKSELEKFKNRRIEYTAVKK